MFVSSKLHEVKPLSIAELTQEIGKGKFTKDQVLSEELKVLECLNFELNLGTIHSFSNMLFRVSNLPPELLPSIEKYATLLQKMYLYSYDILNVFSFPQLAVFSSIISMKLFEHSNQSFCSSKYIGRMIKLSGVSKEQMLQNLNFLRDFASSFRADFPFNRLQSSKSHQGTC